jgi:hypothetical protein
MFRNIMADNDLFKEDRGHNEMLVVGWRRMSVRGVGKSLTLTRVFPFVAGAIVSWHRANGFAYTNALALGSQNKSDLAKALLL